MLSDSPTGRRSDIIEITPEMIAAGVDALFQSDAVSDYTGMPGSLERAASDIFQAMLVSAQSKYQKLGC